MTKLSTCNVALAVYLILLLLGLPPIARAQTATPTWAWATRGASSGPAPAGSHAYQVQADATGNTYTIGNFAGTLALGSSTISSGTWAAGYVAKQAPGGGVSWAQALTSPAGLVYIRQLALDGAGNVYVAGEFITTLQVGALTLTDTVSARIGDQRRNGFVVKFDAAGQPQWAIRLGSAPNALNALANCEGLAADAAGNVVVSGYYSGEVELAGQVLPPVPNSPFMCFVARLTAVGTAAPTVQWVRSTEGLLVGTFMPVALGPAGEIYLATHVAIAMTFGTVALPAPANARGIAVVRYDAAGTVQWARVLQSALPASVTADLVAPESMVANAAGVYLLTSESSRTGPTERRQQLAQFSAQGAAGWQHTYATQQASSYFRGLATDASNNLYVAANVQGTCTLGSLTLSSPSPTSGEAGLLSFTAQGVGRWATLVSSGAGQESVVGLAAGAPDELYTVGSATGAAQLGTFALPATGTGFETLVGHVSIRSITATHPAAPARLQLAPNPAHDFATLTLPAAATPQPLALLDALGRPVRTFTLPAHAAETTVDVAGLPAGVYVLRCGTASRRLVVE